VHKNTPSMASETPHLKSVGLSSSLGPLSSELVEASTVSEVTQETVSRGVIEVKT